MLLQLADSSLPAGGFAHSGGLEALAALGPTPSPDDLERVLAAHLRLSLRRGDAWFVRAAHRAVSEDEWIALSACAQAELAARTTLLQRRSSLALGRNLLRVARTIALPGEQHRLEQLERSFDQIAPRASVFGAAAEVFGVGEHDAAEGHVYSVLAGMIAAAVRLTLLAPLAGQALLRRLLAECVEDPGRDWSLFSPLLDIASMRHEQADGRLFAS